MRLGAWTRNKSTERDLTESGLMPREIITVQLGQCGNQSERHHCRTTCVRVETKTLDLVLPRRMQLNCVLLCVFVCKLA